MELSLLLLNQLLIMLCFSLIGYILAKRKLVTMNGCKEMVNLLLMVVIPFVVLNSFLVEKNSEKTANLFYALLMSLIAFGISIFLSYLIYGTKDRVENFSSAFSNAGFIGIPLVQATLGQEMVFYVAGYVAFLNIFQWIYGAFIMSGDKRTISFKAIATNAVLNTFIISILLYIFGLNEIPYLKNIAQSISQMNSPLAMMIIGIYMSEVSIKDIFTRRSTYLCSLVRLFLIPIISLIVFKFIPFGSEEVKLAVFIVLSAPVGANVAMFAQKYNREYTYAVEIVILSTILSLISLPLLIILAQIVI